MTNVGTDVEIRHYREQGLTKTATALRAGSDRKTVAKNWYDPVDDPDKPRYRQRSKLADPYLEYITERLRKYPELTVERIYRLIENRGFTGSRRTGWSCVAKLREKTYREYKPIET